MVEAYREVERMVVKQLDDLRAVGEQRGLGLRGLVAVALVRAEREGHAVPSALDTDDLALDLGLCDFKGSERIWP